MKVLSKILGPKGVINPATSDDQEKDVNIAKGCIQGSSSFRGFGQRSALSTATGGDVSISYDGWVE